MTPLHDRHSTRLKGWDYSADGTYFRTVCTHDRAHLFGEIIDGQVRLSPAGEVAVRVLRVARGARSGASSR